MSSDEDERPPAEARFFAEDCPECGTPGPARVLSTVNGCRTCMEGNPIPVYTPVRNQGIQVYDAVLPKWPRGELWTPFRDRVPRATGCYRIRAGMVHVKPGCRC